MWVKLRKNVKVDKKTFEKGSVIEVPDDDGKALIVGGAARETAAPATKAAAKAAAKPAAAP